MSRYSFPVISSDKNELVSTKGDLSYFFKVNSVDLEQYNEFEETNFYNGLANSLDNLDGYYKFYKIGQDIYFNTDQKEPSVGLKFSPCSSAINTYFKADDIYSDIGIYDDYIQYNSRYKRIISIKSINQSDSYPECLPKCDYILNIKKKDSESALKRLDHIRKAHKASLDKTRRDFNSEGAYDQAEDLIYKLTHQSESLFDTEIYFILDELSLEELETKTKELVKELILKGFMPYVEGHSVKSLKSGLFDIYRELTPGVRPSFKYRSLPNITSHLKYLVPVSKSELMQSGVSFSDISNNEVSFDPFDKKFKNKNMLVTGSTGGGKSVFVNKLVHSLAAEHPTVILDKGGSFKKLCLYHNGFNLSHGINPMDFRCPYYLREFILSVVDKDKFKKLERGMLLKSIKSFLKLNQDTFRDLLVHLEKDFAGISLYFEDIKDLISNKKLDMNRFLYVDIENFPKTIIAPLIIYVLEYFKNIQDEQKILVFDECWQFLKDHFDYIDESFRTIRKSGAFLIAISQGITDFNKDGLTSSIVNNSYFKVFFPQESVEESFDRLRVDSLSFGKGSFSECYLKCDEYKKILRIYLTDLEYELFHTEANRSESFYQFYSDHRKYFTDNSKTIDAFVRLQHEVA